MQTVRSPASTARRASLTSGITLLFALLLWSPSFGAEPGRLSYKELVKSPSAAKADREFKAYLLGIGYAIRMDHACNQADEGRLKNPDAMIEELVLFASSTWGRLYLEGSQGIGGMHYEMSAGNVLYKMFTEHSRCSPLNRTKEQLEK